MKKTCLSCGIVAVVSSAVDVTTLHWNIHRPCGTDDSGCISAAKQRLAEMASEVGAKVVGAVELKDAVAALPGWQNTGMQCDNSAVMVAPGWSISKSSGHCMNGQSAKGFAVALVTPAEQVQGCPALCIIMGHVPHGSGGISGHSEIVSVCGDAVVSSCSIMMGDWNAEDVSSIWSSLIGGSTTLVEPHEKTCCWHPDPEYKYQYDHTATNIQGATSAGKTVYDPQLTSFSSNSYEHKPVSVQLRLPGGNSPTPAPTPTPTPTPSPSGGGCCAWGGSCDHHDAWCDGSASNCGHCQGEWQNGNALLENSTSTFQVV